MRMFIDSDEIILQIPSEEFRSSYVFLSVITDPEKGHITANGRPISLEKPITLVAGFGPESFHPKTRHVSTIIQFQETNFT